jgi:hypothetical protein
MPSLVTRKRLRHVSNHLSLRRTGDKVGDLLLQRLVPGGNLRF